MSDVRCYGCGKLLGKINGSGEIVCPRCGGKNTFDEAGNVAFQEKRNKSAAILKNRNTSSGMVFRD